MTMKKKIFLLAAVAGLFLLLTGCVGAKTTSSLVFTDTTGAGTKTITFSIPQDGETVLETGTNDEGETTYDYTIYNNSSYFPQGYEAFAEWVISQLPDKGYSYTIDKSDASNIKLDFTYSFTSFADYTDKTKALMGEERWEESKFVDPQLYVSKVEDPADTNYGKMKLTFAESHYMTTSCIARILEIGFSEDAIEAGVFFPFGDVADNADCKAMYKNTHGDGETWREFAIVQFMAVPSNVCGTTGDRTYTMGDVTYVETLGKDGMVTVYVEDNGEWTVTDPMPDSLGTKNKDPQDPKVLDEEGNEIGAFEKYAPADGASWIIIVVIVAVVAVAAVVVIAIVIKKRNDAYEDDDEDEDEEDEDGEDEDGEDAE